MEILEEILQPIDQEIRFYLKDAVDNNQKERTQNFLRANVDARRSVGANVLALWNKEEIGDTGWKTGKSCQIYAYAGQRESEKV